MKISKKKFKQELRKAEVKGFVRGMHRGTEGGIRYANDRIRHAMTETEKEIVDHGSPND